MTSLMKLFGLLVALLAFSGAANAHENFSKSSETVIAQANQDEDQSYDDEGTSDEDYVDEEDSSYEE